MRLRRSNPAGPGYGRRRRGRGVTFLDERGRPIRDPLTVARLRALAIPPAWTDVWICPDEAGHLQATGTDAAGRRQYLYHEQWRRRRDRRKFAHVARVAQRLPRLRRQVSADLGGRGLGRDRVLAAIVRLLDLGLFRIGGDEYAGGDEPSYGVATLRPEHVRCGRGEMTFSYLAKGGLERVQTVADPRVCRLVSQLARQRRGEARLFAYRDGRAWREVRAGDVNEYLRRASGGEMTAKDFRTWHATVRAAVELATAEPQRSPTGRRRMVAAVMREVAEQLGNTPTIARKSYVDPRVVDRYHEGTTIEANGAEAAVAGTTPSRRIELRVLRLLDQA